jgi:glutamine amidotransferase|tara:strand:+ start:340 stop:984 length:645 start_codon:yes stop_codon:yes gene_type:complete
MEKLINIKIIDYGMGNIQSVKNAFELLDCNVDIIDNPSDIHAADGIILPGVGAFGNAINNLEQKKLIDPLKDAVLNKKIPLLGICLGMQLLADSSEERGSSKGLSFISGDIRKIPEMQNYRLPHVGWNDINIKKTDPLFKNILDKSSFYFVHSYRFECDDSYVVATTDYGQNINAVVQKEHIFGVQFHPERSQRKGFHLINNFIDYTKAKKDIL